MKRYLKVGMACLAIMALMADSAGACRWFARRVRCSPCYAVCYPTVVYNSCGVNACSGMPPVEWQPYPSNGIPIVPTPAGSTMPEMPLPPQGQGGAGPMDTGAGRSSSPSDRMNQGGAVPGDRGPAQPQNEPMPEPPAGTTPAPGATPNNPFGGSPTAEPALPADGAQPGPAGGAANPFAPGEPTPGNANPAGSPPAGNNVMPMPSDNAPATTTPPAVPSTDNPFAPGGTAPAPAPVENPFAPPAGTTRPTDGGASSGPAGPAANPGPAPNDQPAVDNPFAPPAGGSASTAEPFGQPAQVPTSDSVVPGDMATPATEDTGSGKQSEPAAPPAVENPFGNPSSGDRASVEPADSIRVWTDVTGKHQVRGRMYKIFLAEQKVRILKETGKFTTVPFDKLSDSDRTFVAQHTTQPSAVLANSR